MTCRKEKKKGCRLSDEKVLNLGKGQIKQDIDLIDFLVSALLWVFSFLGCG